jgi:hypothetical protein
VIIKINKNSSAEWGMFGMISPHLGVIFYDFCKKLRDYGVEEVTITSIIRPVDAIKGETGIHALGRAIDVADTFSYNDIGKYVVDYINNKHVYDIARPKMDCVLYHDSGSGNHYHLQVKK